MHVLSWFRHSVESDSRSRARLQRERRQSSDAGLPPGGTGLSSTALFPASVLGSNASTSARASVFGTTRSTAHWYGHSGARSRDRYCMQQSSHRLCPQGRRAMQLRTVPKQIGHLRSSNTSGSVVALGADCESCSLCVRQAPHLSPGRGGSGNDSSILLIQRKWSSFSSCCTTDDQPSQHDLLQSPAFPWNPLLQQRAFHAHTGILAGTQAS